MGRIRERMEADLELKGFARTTRKDYLLRARHFVAYHGRSPEQLGETEIRDFLLHLVQERGARATTHRMYVAALKFLFIVTLRRPEAVAAIPWPKVPRTLPDILSGEEVERLIGVVRSLKYQALLMTAYGAGLRVSEACTLEVGDIDSKRMIIHVREGRVLDDEEGDSVVEEIADGVEDGQLGRLGEVVVGGRHHAAPVICSPPPPKRRVRSPRSRDLLSWHSSRDRSRTRPSFHPSCGSVGRIAVSTACS